MDKPRINLQRSRSRLGSFLNQSNTLRIDPLNQGKYSICISSRTLREDSKRAFLEEVDKNTQYIDQEKTEKHIIYISSQTLTLTNSTWYSKAKKELEDYIIHNCNKYTIIRPGFIISEIHQSRIKETLRKVAEGGTYCPKITKCSPQDIADCISKITTHGRLANKKTINIGIKQYDIFALTTKAQSKANSRKSLKIKIPLAIFKSGSMVSARLKAYSSGSAICSKSSVWAFQSEFD